MTQKVEGPRKCCEHLRGPVPFKRLKLTTALAAFGVFAFYARGPPTVNRLMTEGLAGV